MDGLQQTLPILQFCMLFTILMERRKNIHVILTKPLHHLLVLDYLHHIITMLEPTWGKRLVVAQEDRLFRQTDKLSDNYMVNAGTTAPIIAIITHITTSGENSVHLTITMAFHSGLAVAPEPVLLCQHHLHPHSILEHVMLDRKQLSMLQ